jgi:hypothetical protein
LVLLVTTTALAAERLTELATKLRSDKDFRVRTQAALALGVSKDARAVTPLCKGLDDENRTVRAASAAALGKLELGGEACITRRLQREPHPKVKRMLTKVLARLRSSAPSKVGPNTRYYVAIGPTTNKTQRPNGEIERLVRQSLTRELVKESTLALAPENEAEEAAKRVLAEHVGLKSIFIWPKVQATASGSKLKLKFSFTLFSYPDKAFKGSMSKTASVGGGRIDSLEDLQQLVETLAPAIVHNFLTNVDRLP